MFRKIVAVWVSLAMLLGFVVIVDVVTDITPPVKGATITVDDSGGAMYTKIQNAINASNNGDTVFVYSGIYNENVVVNKSINLIGEDKNNTIIDGNGNGDVVKINEDYVNMSKFTVRNSGSEEYPDYDAGIELDNVHNCSIIYNNISNNEYGIYTQASCNNVITDNNITNNEVGIDFAYSNNTQIINNNMQRNINFGISMRYSNENTISANIISEHENKGVYLRYSNSTFIVNNTFSSNVIADIDLASHANNNIILGNYLSAQMYGIHFRSSSNNVFSGNNVTNNDSPITLFSLSNDNIISGNVFFNTSGEYSIHDSNRTQISDNEFINSNCPGLDNSHNTSIFNNTFKYGRISIGRSYNTNIYNNDLSYGNIYISESKDSAIFSNRISFAHYAISIKRSNNISISYNFIYNNRGGLQLDNSSNNKVHHNTFIGNYNPYINNEVQVEIIDSHNNEWDDGYGEGNFWSDYKGVDDGSNNRIAGDGIGDTEIPHPFEDRGYGYYHLDNYPLIEPIPDTLPPRIKLDSPENNSVILQGVPINFSIIEANLDNVEYSINQGDYVSFTEPYHFLTDEWEDGDYTIHFIASDIYGNSNTTWFFFTKDVTPPFVVTATQTNNSLNFALRGAITFTFSEPMNWQDAEHQINISPYNQYTKVWDSTKTMLYISFESYPLEEGTTYTFVIKSSIADVPGNQMGNDYILVFTTFSNASDNNGEDPPDTDESRNDVSFIQIFISIILGVIIVLLIRLYLKRRNKIKKHPDAQGDGATLEINESKQTH